jgi:hypothetical protein
MLYAGFMGSACWSQVQLPTPYPLPFGSSFSALFSWLDFTTLLHIFTRVTHGYYARRDSGLGFQLPPFHPASGVDG